MTETPSARFSIFSDLIIMNRFFNPRHFFAAVFIVAFGFSLCKTNSEEVEWNPNWNVGDRFTVELVKERTTGKVAIDKGRVRLDMSVQEKGKNFYLLHCTYGRFELEGPQKNNPLVAKMTNLSEGLCLKIKTDKAGLPQKLTNIDEIVEKTEKTIDLLEDFMKENKLPQTMIVQTIAPVRAMYQKPESVQSAMLNELSLFFLFCGAALEPDNASEFDELLPNPFQGEPLPGKGTIQLKEFDKQAGMAVVEYRLTIDKEKAAPILFASMKKMMPQASGPAKEEMPQMDISDQTLYRIDTKKGWPLSVEHSRNIKLNGKSGRVQNLSFKTVEERK